METRSFVFNLTDLNNAFINYEDSTKKQFTDGKFDEEKRTFTGSIGRD